MVLPYTQVVAGSSTNVTTPTTEEINQGNNQLTPYNSAINNGYYRQMSQGIAGVNAEIINAIEKLGGTPDEENNNLASVLGTAAAKNTGIENGNVPVIGTQSSTSTLAGLSCLPSQIAIANNALDPANDIDFSAGNFIVSDGSAQGVSSAETKRLNATWAAGNNAGGLAAGLTKTAGTWYDCFKLYNPTTGATGSGFDTSATASNLLADPAVITAGFTKYKRVNSIQTNSSTNTITPIKQIGNRTYYSGQWYQDISAATTSTSSVVTSLTMPPRPGLIAITQINLTVNNDNGSVRGLIQNNDFSAPLSDTLFNLYAQDNIAEVERTNQELEIPTDSSGRVKRVFSGVVGCSFNLWTKGWIDTTL